MSDKDGIDDKTSSGKGWTDKERLTYLFALIEHSNIKFDYTNAPRPLGRTEVACKLMVSRLKSTLKNELAALKEGSPIQGGSSSNTSAATPRKRKTKSDLDAGETPSKRGRKKKVQSEEEVEDSAADEDVDIKVKPESLDGEEFENES